MGDPRKQRKKFVTPAHPWERSRIEEERGIIKKFGLKNKKEIWKMQSLLRNFKMQAKDIIRRTDEEAKRQQEHLMQKLVRWGIVSKGTEVEKILDLATEDIMERRLQSMVVRQKLAHSMKQARQFIIHGHITINNQAINVPSYIVKKDEEKTIGFKEGSTLKDPDHPERRKEPKEEKKGKLVKQLKKRTGKVDKREEPTPPKEETLPKEPDKHSIPPEEEQKREGQKPEAPKEELQPETPPKKSDEEVVKEVLKKVTDEKIKGQELGREKNA